ncbi:MAG TPA: lysophospholipid acyltransferase family protein [Candidatus Limnocylindrales bacterium]|nr:lysophospholipid acyltransferase family protein [Candidatus Limnocylindrales bacterium]
MAAARPRLPLVFRALNRLMWLGLRLIGTRVVVEGAEHIPDAPGVIVAFNHLSITDPPIVSITLERLAGRRVRFMAKAEAFEQPVVGPLMAAYGGFPVRRGRADREAYRAALEVLRAGEWLGLAPEGTRSRTGTLGEPKPGAVLLAMRAGAPVLPIGVAGTEQVWPVGRRLPRFGQRVTLRIGEPWLVERSADAEAASEELMRRIAALLPAHYRGRYG